MVHFGEFLKTWSLRSNSVTRQVSFNKTKVGGKCQNWKTQMRHFGWFSNTVHVYLIDFSAISKVLSLSQNPVNFNDFLHSFLMDWQVQVMCLPGYLMTSFKAQECKRVNLSTSVKGLTLGWSPAGCLSRWCYGFAGQIRHAKRYEVSYGCVLGETGRQKRARVLCRCSTWWGAVQPNWGPTLKRRRIKLAIGDD